VIYEKIWKNHQNSTAAEAKNLINSSFRRQEELETTLWRFFRRDRKKSRLIWEKKGRKESEEGPASRKRHSHRSCYGPTLATCTRLDREITLCSSIIVQAGTDGARNSVVIQFVWGSSSAPAGGHQRGRTWVDSAARAVCIECRREDVWKLSAEGQRCSFQLIIGCHRRARLANLRLIARTISTRAWISFSRLIVD